MRMTVQYLAQIKRAAGRSMEHVEAPDGITLRDLVRYLGGRDDRALHALLLDKEEEPHGSLLFFVGEEHAELSRPLCDGDALTILTPMSGG
jgi:sulfur-carrier protein